MRFSAFLIPVALTTAPAIAQQAAPVSLKAETFLAKMVKNAQGKEEPKLLPALRVLPGDPLVLSYTYANNSGKPVDGFSIDNKVPDGVEFTRIPDNVGMTSVDGGKSFGALATLKVKGPDGKLRPALPSDVTNVRWRFARLAPGAKGNVMYYGVVR